MRKSTSSTSFQGHQLPNTGYGPLDRKILSASMRVLDTALSHHDRVNLARLDFRCPGDYDQEFSNQAFSATMAELKRYCDRKDYGMSYVAVKELGQDGKPHIHAAIFTDGARCKSSYYIYQKAEEIWEKKICKRQNI